jgi:hypothetical protein
MVRVEGGREIEHAVLEADRPGIGHALDQEMPRIFKRRQRRRIRAWRTRVVRARWRPAMVTVRPLSVVLLAEHIEGALLGPGRRARWTNGAALQRPMHALLRAVYRRKPMTRQQNANVLISDGERIAVDVILHAELAAEVGRPQIVRLDRDRIHDARMRGRSAPAARDHQAFPCEDRPGGADRGTVVDARVAWPRAPCVRQ